MSRFNPGPESHRFNWGRAYVLSSPEVQFGLLLEAFEQAVSALNGDDQSAPRTDIRFHSDSDTAFYICRQSPPDQQGRVYIDEIFFRYNAGRILIQDTRAGLPMGSLTTVLKDDGQIRFQIDEKGDYLRWQIVRKYLEGLLGQSGR